MSAYSYGMLAVISFSLAGVCAILTLIFYFAKHVRQVHDDLTGRTAERAIAELRQGKGSRSRFFGGDERSGSDASRSGRLSRASRHETAGSLKLRRISADDIATSKMHDAEGEAGTTMLACAGDSESGTTLLGSAAAPSESGTTLLADPSSEGATSLLADDPRKESC